MRQAHKALKEINGIADKIASIILRDIVVLEKIVLKKDIEQRVYVQPIDIWIRRYCNILGGISAKMNWKKYAEFIVNKSFEHNAIPEKVNMGMWYFASQIVGSYYKLLDILNRGYNEIGKLAQEHLDIFKTIDKSKFNN